MTPTPRDPSRRSPEDNPLPWHSIPWDSEPNADWKSDLVEHSQDLLCVHDLQGRLLSVNPVPARVLGYSVEEILQIPMRDLLAPEFREQFDIYLREVEHAGASHGVMAVLTRTGERRFWEYHNTLRTDGVKAPIVRGIAHDVTERVCAEKTMREMNKKLLQNLIEQESRVRELKLFRTLLDHSNDAIEVIDPETMRFLDVNEKGIAELGYSREELLSMTIFDIDPKVTRDSVARVMEELQKSGFVILESTHRRKDGTTFPVEVNIKRVQLEKEYVVALSRDITERKRAAALLEESEKLFRAVHERAPVGIALVDSRSGRFLRVNPKLCEIAGRAEEEMLQLTLRDVTHPDDLATSVESLNQLVEENTRSYDIEKRYVRPNGEVVRVTVSVVPMWAPGEEARWHMAIVQDITERRLAEKALRESEERLRLAQEVAQIGTFERNLQTGDSQWTPQMELLYGITAGEFPRTIDKFLELVHPEDRQQVTQWVSQSMESGDAHGEWRVIWPDRSVRWISGRWHVFTDASGKPARVIGMDFDITERKQREEELRQAKERLTEEKLYLEQEIDAELGFEDIIGRSKALKAVMDSVGKVATSGASVLLLGETGTGKELVARAIHRLSHRSGSPFIKLNCAAIPSGLLESELFGNEKGAFTGAVGKKIGRLELAAKGTLFLDEIGEISLELQPKLLRVLQDQEFERLGGTQTLKGDFRLIAATNRDLPNEVREREFRSDLYYRLSVFPIRIPPLRERRDDIPLLVEHFVHKCARRMNKSITSIPKKTMDALAGWDWPGNIRELENFVERSVILTRGSVLAAPLYELRATVEQKNRDRDETLEAAEREHILTALRESRGQISGPRGAATRLGLKRTTLQSKLKQMGINPRVPPPGH